MSKQRQNTNTLSDKPDTGLVKVTQIGEITEYVLQSNDLRVLYVKRPNTGIVTTNIVYKVGSRDEAVGETGIAHMFEHMLFKPTSFDVEAKKGPAVMQMEREVGAVINANTWKDRTTYFISYPKEHFDRALKIEAERMRGLVLSEEEFKAEQGNVLSEFDMYAGDEHFALSVQMMGVAFQSHPYGHETIGYREDIESYTVEKLRAFYDMYYAPNNAVLTVVGDIEEKVMKEMVVKHFSPLKKSETLKKRLEVKEPKQEGKRSITIERPSTTQIYALGIKHEGFPSKGWFETMVIFDLLTGGEDSILHKELIDKNFATAISASLEPSFDQNLGVLFITLSKKTTHKDIESKVNTILKSLTTKMIAPYLQKTIAKALTHEFVSRENSLGYTAELVEYVSADAWKQFFDSEKILRSITVQDIQKRLTELFDKKMTTVGYYVGTK